MEDIKPGDIVYLTKAYDAFVRSRNPNLSMVLTNRLAKVEEIIDWDTDRGRLIREARLKSGKWKDLPLEENKYILSIFYPDLVGRKGQKGVAERGMPMWRFHPQDGVPFFEKLPGWLYRDLVKQCETFGVERKDVA